MTRMWTFVVLGFAFVVGRDAGAESEARRPGLDDARLIDVVAVEAGNPDDAEVWRRMLLDALAGSPTMRQLLIDIGSETDPARAVRVVVVRDHPGVFIDSFQRSLVDLEDLERLPSAHAAGLEADEVTREEQLVHILAERRHAAKMTARLREMNKTLSAEELFAVAHELGLAQENSYRAERGQTSLLDSTSHAVRDRPDQAVIEYTLANGTTSIIVTLQYGRIFRIVPPRAAAR